MTIQRVHHHTFTVSDMDRSLAFYRDLLGFTLMYDKLRENLPVYDKVMEMKDVKVRVVLLQDATNESIVALLHYHHPPLKERDAMSMLYVGSTALAVETDDIDADYGRLHDAGVRFTCPPVDVVRDGQLAARLAYAFDPDGIVVELYQPVKN